MRRPVKSYDFPNATIQRLPNGRFVEFYKWCSSIRVERSRTYVGEALQLLRRYRRMVRAVGGDTTAHQQFNPPHTPGPANEQ